jgi:predicted transcriptional regulator of viral defense system
MQKVGVSLIKKEIIQKVIINNGGIAKTADFVAAGIQNYEVAALCKEGYIERIRRGFYQLPNGNQITEEQLLQELLPQGIICVESALFHYGYSDFAPREWSVAVPRTASRSVKKIEEFPIKAYYIQKDFLPIGKSIDNFNSVELAVYDRERTICDCFKYRTKLDNETFNKAVNAYAADKNKNLANLSKYAREMKLYTKVMNVMEVLLNG